MKRTLEDAVELQSKSSRAKADEEEAELFAQRFLASRDSPIQQDIEAPIDIDLEDDFIVGGDGNVLDYTEDTPMGSLFNIFGEDVNIEDVEDDGGAVCLPSLDECVLVDIPERYQNRRVLTHDADGDVELIDEAGWIFNLIDVEKNSSIEKLEAVKKILELIRIQNVEVPYILRYQKDEWYPMLRESDVWEINKLNESWPHFYAMKSKVTELLRIVSPDDEVIEEYLRSITTESQLSDFHSYLHFIRKQAERSIDEPDLSLELFVNRIILSPTELAENLHANNHIHLVDDIEENIENFALAYVSSEFPDPESVIQAAIRIAVARYIQHPMLRAFVKSEFIGDSAVFSTVPTTKGRSSIPSHHEYYPVKRIRYKPLKNYITELGTGRYADNRKHFLNAENYLLAVDAEKKGFITKSIELRSHDQNVSSKQVLEETFFNMALCSSISQSATIWNRIRKEILVKVVAALHDIGVKHAESRLLSHSRSVLSFHIGELLQNQLLVAPSKSENDQPARLVAAIHGQGSAPSYFVALNEQGEVLDHLILTFLKNRTQYKPNDADQKTKKGEREIFERKKADKASFQKFIRMHHPSSILIAADSSDCRDFEESISKAVADHHPPISVHFVDPAPAKAFAYSSIAQEQFPNYPVPLRYAVGIARFIHDPLSFYSSLWVESGVNNPILSVKMHYLQHLIPQEDLLGSLRKVFIKTVDDVGVDINAIINRSHLCGVLQFVSGLGHHKALYLLSKLGVRGYITQRENLLTEEIVGPIVYRNCVGVLLIRDNAKIQAADLSPELTFFDSTRIHPENYGFARQVVVDALEEYRDDSKIEIFVEQLRRKANISKLDDLDLDAYASSLEDSNQGKKKFNLYNIKSEIQNPAVDNRHKRLDILPEKLFYMLTGENERTFVVGLTISARIVKLHERSAICILDNGVFGFLPEMYVIEERVENAISTMLTHGGSIIAKILEIDHVKNKVVLSILRHDLEKELVRSDVDYAYMRPKDETEEEKEITRKEEKELKKAKELIRFVPKKIESPHFHNISSEKAVEMIKDDEIGSFIVRPSTLGTSHLTITWKFYEDVILHTDVIETRKDGTKIYSIHSSEYEDLDDIEINYINLIKKFIKDLVEYKLFQFGDENDMLQILQEMKHESPHKIPYCFCVSSKKVSPTGYLFEGYFYNSVIKLINEFKTYISQLIAPQQNLQQRYYNQDQLYAHDDGTYNQQAREYDRDHYRDDYDDYDRDHYRDRHRSHRHRDDYRNDRHNRRYY